MSAILQSVSGFFPTPFPESVRRLFWDVDPNDVDPKRHRDYVLERVMVRGDWEAMRWLRHVYSLSELRDFLQKKGARLPPRDFAYWALIAGLQAHALSGGGRPPWTKSP